MKILIRALALLIIAVPARRRQESRRRRRAGRVPAREGKARRSGQDHAEGRGPGARAGVPGRARAYPGESRPRRRGGGQRGQGGRAVGGRLPRRPGDGARHPGHPRPEPRDRSGRAEARGGSGAAPAQRDDPRRAGAGPGPGAARCRRGRQRGKGHPGGRQQRRRPRRSRRGAARRRTRGRRGSRRAQGRLAQPRVDRRKCPARLGADRPGQGGRGRDGGPQGVGDRRAIGRGVRRPRLRDHRRRPEEVGRRDRAGAAGRVPEPAQPGGADRSRPHLRSGRQPGPGGHQVRRGAEDGPDLRSRAAGAGAGAGRAAARPTRRLPARRTSSGRTRRAPTRSCCSAACSCARATGPVLRLRWKRRWPGCRGTPRRMPGSAPRTSSPGAPRKRWPPIARRSSSIRRTWTTARRTASCSASTRTTRAAWPS